MKLQDKTIACILYSIVTIGITFTNKLILGSGPSAFHFNCPTSLLILQSASAVGLSWVASKFWAVAEVPALEINLVLTWIPLNIMFVMMLVTSTFSLQVLSVAMVTIFKNMQTISIAVGDRAFFGRPLSWGTQVCIFVMFFGSIAAGYNDLEFNAAGYFWITINCACGTAYVLYTKHAMTATKLSKFGSTYYNNLLSIPFLLMILLFRPEFPNLKEFNPSPLFIIVLILNCVFGFAISLATFWVVKSTSPTTATILGAVNKVPLSIVSIWWFATPFNIPGAVSSIGALSGGVIYAITEYLREKAESEAPKDVKDPKDSIV